MADPFAAPAEDLPQRGPTPWLAMLAAGHTLLMVLLVAAISAAVLPGFLERETADAPERIGFVVGYLTSNYCCSCVPGIPALLVALAVPHRLTRDIALVVFMAVNTLFTGFVLLSQAANLVA